MPTPNEELLERFYGAFARATAPAMAACYAPDVTFSDPVFTDLHGAEAGAMWRMLTGRAKDLEVELLEREADGERGSAHWRATYTYSQTGRPVVNDVRGTFRFAGRPRSPSTRTRSGSTAGPARRSAPPGLLLGWTPMLRSTVRRRAREALDEFMAGSTRRTRSRRQVRAHADA